MKRIVPFILLLLLIPSCIYSGAGYRRITMDEAAELMENENGFILLDVRTKEEYESGHIPHSKNLPLGDIGSSPISILPDKSQMILVYCRSGNRSRQASEKLVKLGYTSVVEIGGINSWKGEIVR